MRSKIIILNYNMMPESKGILLLVIKYCNSADYVSRETFSEKNVSRDFL